MNECISRKLSGNEIIDVLRKANYCRLAVAENNIPYIVPMYYMFRWDGNRLVFILYSKSTGEKMRCMRNNPNVSLEFEVGNCCTMRTVVAKGVVVKFKEDSCDLDDGMVELIIKTTSISGRAFDM